MSVARLAAALRSHPATAARIIVEENPGPAGPAGPDGNLFLHWYKSTSAPSSQKGTVTAVKPSIPKGTFGIRYRLGVA